MFILEVAQYLDEKGIGDYEPSDTTGSIFINKIPPEPTNLISLWTSGGDGADVKLGYDFPKMQVITRGDDVVDAYEKAKDIYNELHGLSSSLLGDFWVVSCIGIQSDPSYIGEDKNGLHEYSINFVFDVRNISIHRE